MKDIRLLSITIFKRESLSWTQSYSKLFAGAYSVSDCDDTARSVRINVMRLLLWAKRVQRLILIYSNYIIYKFKSFLLKKTFPFFSLYLTYFLFRLCTHRFFFLHKFIVHINVFKINRSFFFVFFSVFQISYSNESKLSILQANCQKYSQRNVK